MIKSYKDLESYKESYALTMGVFWLTRKFPKKEIYSLASQVAKSSRSVATNIAEAWVQRVYEGIFKQHLFHALGSNKDTENWLDYIKIGRVMVTNKFNKTNNVFYIRSSEPWSLVTILEYSVSCFQPKWSNFRTPISSFQVLITILFLFGTLAETCAQTLDDYLQEGLANNPELKALGYQYEIAKTTPDEVNKLGDTRFGIGYFVQEPETRTGAQKTRFSMLQQLPIMGVARSQKNEAIAAIDVEKNRIEIAKRKLLLTLKKTYYELYALKRKSDIIETQKTLLKNYHETALSALENNKISAVAVLKIKIAQNDLQQEDEILKGAVLNTEKTFNTLLNRDGFEELIIPKKLAIPEEEPTMALDEVTYHPEALQFDYADTIIEKKRTTNARERLPSLSIGLDYVIVEERPNLDFSDNGKDIVMPMISFSAPIFSKKHRTKAKQYQLAQEGLQQQRTHTENALSQRLETAINNRITARIVYDTQLKNIEQAKHAEEMLLTSYQTGIIDFDAILELQEMQLDFEFEQIESVKEYFIQTAIINYML